MFTARWRLFRLFGIPLYVDASWLIILALVTWWLSDIFRQGRPEMAPVEAIGLGLATAIIYFICIVLHEFGHAIVGRAEGMRIRGITLFLFGGVAELADEPPSAGAEFLMAIAGPVVSAVLGGLFLLGSFFTSFPDAHLMLWNLGVINLSVMALNMVPAFPLDGGRVFRSAFWAATHNLRRATYFASLLGQGFAWLLIVFGVLFLFMGVWGGLWWILIGLFLNSAARSSYRSVLVRQLLEGEPVQRFMNTAPITVPPSLDLRTWVEEYVYRHHRKAFPVVQDGKLEGIITTRDVASLPRAEWDAHTVADVMRHDFDSVRIAPDTDAMHALAQMQRTGSSRLLVTEGDHLRGIVSLKDLLRFLSLKMEFESHENEPPRPSGPWHISGRREQNVPH